MKYVVLVLLLLFSAPATARDLLGDTEHLELFPKSRAAYNQKFDERTERYEIDRRAYNDNLYQTHGEAGLKEGEPMLPESTLDAVLDSAGTQQSAAKNGLAKNAPPRLNVTDGVTTAPQ